MKKQPIVSINQNVTSEKAMRRTHKISYYLALIPLLLVGMMANAMPVSIGGFTPPSQNALTTVPVNITALDASNMPTSDPINIDSQSPSVCQSVGGNQVYAQKSGMCTIHAYVASDPSVQRTFSWAVTPVVPVMTVNIPTTIYVNDLVSVAVTVEGNSPYTITVLTPANCELNGSSSIKALAAGGCRFKVTSAGDDIYVPQSETITFTIQKRTQTITPDPIVGSVYVNVPKTITASATSALPVTFSATGVCTIAGGQLIGSAAGNCTLTYHQAGDAQYEAAADIPVLVTVEKRNQTITAGVLPASVHVTDSFSVAATSESGLSVAIAASGSCTIVGATITATAEGDCIITYNQAGDASYFAAAEVEKKVIVTKKTQQITVNPVLPTALFVNDTVNVAAISDSGLPVIITATGNCTLAGSLLTATAQGSCVVKFSQAGDEVYSAATISPEITISKRQQTLSVVAPTDAIFDETFSVSANASSGLVPVSITSGGACTFENGTNNADNSGQLIGIAAGNCLLTFNQTGNIEFAAKNASRTVIIKKANQDINILTGIPEHGTINVDYPVSAEASSNLAVAITVSGDCIKVGNNVRPKTPVAGSGSCVVSYQQAGDSNYNPAPTLTESMIVQVGQTINITQLPPVSGQFDATVQTAATTSSGLPVHISVDDQYCKLSPEPALGDNFVLGTAGINLTAIGTCKITYSQPGGEIGGVWFDPAPTLNRTVTVDRWNQSIKITRKPPASQQAGTAVVVEAVAEPADAENPRPVTITIAAGSSCTMQSSAANEATIVLGTTGNSCTLYFNQSGNALYKPAPQLSKTITISQVTDGSNIGNYWPSHKLFTTGTSAAQRQPIMAPPMVARNGDIKAPEPNVMVIFGTGKYHEERDLSDKSLHAIYGIHDRGEYNITRYNKKTGSEKLMLAKRVFSEKSFTVAGVTQNNRKVSGDAVDWVHQYGWYVDLASDLNNNGSIDASEKLGERSVFRPFIANKLYVFNTVLPTVGTCSGATQGWTMLIDWASGLAPNFATYDANMDGGFDSADKGFVGYYNETAGSELGRGGDSIYDTSGSEARRRSVTFGTADSGIRLGWEEKTPYGVLKRDAN